MGTAEYRHAQAPPSCRVGCVAVVAHARYGHPLRFYITPHFVKWSPVATLKLRFVSSTASAPSRVHKTGLMQSGLRWVRSHSRRRFPVACAPYAPPAVRPFGCRGAVASVRRCAHCSGQWPAASHLVCAPAHPRASPLRGISPARWSARPPPVGAPSARAPLSLGFATSLVAGHARNTGATGLTACKPAWPLAYYFTPTSQAATASALSCTLGVQCPRSSCTTMRCLTMRSTVLMRSITRQMGSLPWA